MEIFRRAAISRSFLLSTKPNGRPRISNILFNVLKSLDILKNQRNSRGGRRIAQRNYTNNNNRPLSTLSAIVSDRLRLDNYPMKNTLYIDHSSNLPLLKSLLAIKIDHLHSLTNIGGQETSFTYQLRTSIARTTSTIIDI